MTIILKSFLFAFGAASVLASDVEAQKARPPRDVTLIQLDSAPSGARAMVYHRASGKERDVVALGPATRPHELTAALGALDALYAKLDSQPDRDVALGITSVPEMEASPRTKLHGAFVQQLRDAKRRDVRGFGTVKALSIKVPNRKPSKP